ncbi:MAG TPA: hypothetical protein VF766_01905, partial [Pyrinomonadaceae bacterium]
MTALMLSCSINYAQNQPATTQTPTAPQPAQKTAQPTTTPRQSGFDFSEYGVTIKPEPRLLIVLAALDAAGFDPTPAGEEQSLFRAQLRRDLANLDPDLRQRLNSFYERNKLQRGTGGREPSSAEQAARYISLAYALGSAPGFEEPPRSSDLPVGVLEVLDFAPLVREFYRKSGIDERMPDYLRQYQSEGDRLRSSTAAMVYGVIKYLNTRPIRTTIERVPVKPPAGQKQKKDAPIVYTTREHERRFFVVPDLLAAPGTINLRIIADDYFVIVPSCDETKRYCYGRDNNPASPEVRRAYIQYIVDPLVVRFNRDIAARKEPLKKVLDARTAAGATISPDIFLMVGRSLVVAIDARVEETTKTEALTREATNRLDKTTDAARRAEIIKELEAARAGVADEAIAQLAEGYESGAPLAFY